MSNKTRRFLWIIATILLVGIWFFNNNSESNTSIIETIENTLQDNVDEKSVNVKDISALTDERIVVEYVRKHNRLPDYYMTKREANSKGWNSSKGNLCDVLPGIAIGGDHFGNREGLLPKKSGRKYFEADLNYNCGRRNADRLVYSNDGLIFITKDHYKSFQKQ